MAPSRVGGAPWPELLLQTTMPTAHCGILRLVECAAARARPAPAAKAGASSNGSNRGSKNSSNSRNHNGSSQSRQGGFRLAGRKRRDFGSVEDPIAAKDHRPVKPERIGAMAKGAAQAVAVRVFERKRVGHPEAQARRHNHGHRGRRGPGLFGPRNLRTPPPLEV